MRTIHTNLFTTNAYDIIRAVRGQCSDGILVNNSFYDKYWIYLGIKLDVNGEILLIVPEIPGKIQWGYKYVKNGFFNMTDADVKKEIAMLLKKIVKIYCKDNYKQFDWRRDNNDECDYINAPVWRAYLVYEMLLDRNVEKHYTAEQLNMTVGSINNDIQDLVIEMKTEKEKLMDEKNNACKELEAKIVAMREELDAKIVAMREELEAKFKETNKLFYEKWSDKLGSNFARFA